MVVGVIGSGPSARKATNALLDDFFSNEQEVRLVLPGTVPEFTDAVRHVADWALDRGVEMVFLVDTHNQTDLDDYSTSAEGPVITEVTNVRDVLGEFVDTLFVAWDDQDEIEPFVEAAIKRGIPAYDLSTGLAPLILDETPAEVPQQRDANDVVAQAEAQPADEAQALVLQSEPKQGKEVVDTSDWLAGPKVQPEFLDLVIHELFQSSFVDDITDAVVAKIRERL